ncbi:MAG TPA: signal peptidase II [Deltaproteobacteria bacterium]|nr:signal peptidase II [Deltaproteobacteria bacterium]
MNASFKFQILSFEKDKYLRLIFIAGLIVVLDQITKLIVLDSLPLFHSIKIIPGFFNLTHIHNPGGAFGFLAANSSSIQRFVFLFASSLAIGLVLYFYNKTPKSFVLLSTGFALVIGGALGNLIDRIRMGKVVDFLDFHIGDLHWPAFNVADSAVSIGMIIFVYHLVFKKLPE